MTTISVFFKLQTKFINFYWTWFGIVYFECVCHQYFYDSSSTGSKVLNSESGFDDSEQVSPGKAAKNKSKEKAKRVKPEPIAPKKQVELLNPTKEQLDRVIGTRGPDYQAYVSNGLNSGEANQINIGMIWLIWIGAYDLILVGF